MPKTSAQSPPEIRPKIIDLARALAIRAARRDYKAEQESHHGKQNKSNGDNQSQIEKNTEIKEQMGRT